VARKTSNTTSKSKSGGGGGKAQAAMKGGNVRVNLLRGEDLVAGDRNGLSDPFVVLTLNEQPKKKFKSKVIAKTLNPVWNSTFYFDVADPSSATVFVECWDHDLIGRNDALGTAEFSFLGLAEKVDKELVLALKGVPHGKLHLSLVATNFDTTSASAHTAAVGVLRVTVSGARNLIPMDKCGTSDPFVTLKLQDKSRLFRTSKLKKTLDPVWEESFDFEITDPKCDLLRFFVYDFDKYSTNDFLGECSLPCMAVINLGPDAEFDDYLPLLDKWQTTRKPTAKERGDLRVKARWYGPDLASLNKDALSRRSARSQSDRDVPAAATAAAAAAAAAAADPTTDSPRDAPPPAPVPLLTKQSSEASFKKPPPLRSRWEIDAAELQLGRELGRGAFGVVFKARWRQQDVAVKQIQYSNITPLELESFKREAELMMDLRPHKNIVCLLGVCADPGVPLCIVTEYVEGGSLESLLRSQQQLNWPMILHICQGICAGMFHLHEEAILHRDLAARNILLEPMTSARGGTAQRWTPLITDFGLSKRVVPDDSEGYACLPAPTAQESTTSLAAAAERAATFATAGRNDVPVDSVAPPAPVLSRNASLSLSSVSSTRDREQAHRTSEPSTQFRGPYKYFAPESLRSLKSGQVEFSTKTDVWSYGVLVWEIMTRSSPFPGVDLFLAAHKIAHEGLRLPIPTSSPSKFRNLMLACWHDDPSERPSFNEIYYVILAEIESEIDSY
jgi:serine/threonine protein kinase